MCGHRQASQPWPHISCSMHSHLGHVLIPIKTLCFYVRLQNLDMDLLQCILQARLLLFMVGAFCRGLSLRTGAGTKREASKRRTAVPRRHVLELPFSVKSSSKA